MSPNKTSVWATNLGKNDYAGLVRVLVCFVLDQNIRTDRTPNRVETVPNQRHVRDCNRISGERETEGNRYTLQPVNREGEIE